MIDKIIYWMTFLTLILINNQGAIQAQSLGGYQFKDCLSTAIHPYGCDPNYVLGMPDDSILVNFNPGDILTGNFTNYNVDSTGNDILLETGFNTSSYIVSLLLSNGLYSAQHIVDTSDWQILDSLAWRYRFIDCATNGTKHLHFILPLDFNIDFGLTTTDTVVGIKIEFLACNGYADIAGAYIISSQSVGFNSSINDDWGIVYPNPLSDHVTFTNFSTRKTDLLIYDLNLKILKKVCFTKNTTIDTMNFPKGIYTYRIYAENGFNYSGVIIKE